MINVLLSIKPVYVDEILTGRKTFEFRKSIFKKEGIARVFIYSSSPVKKIVASFEIAGIIANSPQKLWEKCQKYGGISENDFFDYFKNSDIGYAIEIANLNKFPEPIDPYKIKKNFRPPQSYRYLPLDYFENKNINSIPRVKNEDMVLFESDYEYCSDLNDNKNSNKIQKQAKLLNGDAVQKIPEMSGGSLENSMMLEKKAGWAETELDQIVEVIMGQSPPSSTYNENGIGLPFFQGKAEFTELYPIASKWCSEPKKIAEPNDILISVRAPVGATNIANQKCCIGRGLAAIRYSDCNKYIFYFLRLIENELDKKGTGTTFKAISGSVLKNEIIPVAPLSEQRAIVSKIEQLFSELDNGIANLKLIQEQLKVYRQAVLKKAFEGELTKKWREQQTDLPDTGELLKQICTERKRVSKNPRMKVKSIKPLTENEINKLPTLPEEWQWVKLNEVTIKADKVNRIEKSPEEEFKYLDIGGINNKTNKLENFKIYKWINAPSRAQQIVYKGDILFSTVRTYLKNIAKIESEIFNGEICSSGFTVIRSLKNYIDENYVFYLSISDGFIQPLNELQTGTSYPAVRDNDVLSQPFPLCSLPEQQAIVQEIETRLSVCDKIEQDIEVNLEKAEALRQSILKKAFEGKLLNEKELAEVRGAEDWEPAEVLLERIKAERARNGKK